MPSKAVYAGDCVLAERLAGDAVVRFAQWQQIAGCVAGAVTLLPFLAGCGRRMPPLLTGVAKVFVLWTIALLILHNFCVFSVQIWHQILYAVYPNEPCGYRMLTWRCLLLRAPSIGTIVALNAVHVFMVVDRFYESYFPDAYYRRRRRRGAATAPSFEGHHKILLFTFQTGLTIGLLLYVFYGEELRSYKFYCVASSSANNDRMMRLYALLIASDALCTVGFVAVLRKSFTRLRRNEHGFVVNRKLAMRSNIAALRFMIASTGLRAVFYGPFLAANAATRFFIHFNDFIVLARVLENFYLLQWYGCALAALLYYWRPFTLRGRPAASMSAHDEHNHHFQQLAAAWSSSST